MKLVARAFADSLHRASFFLAQNNTASMTHGKDKEGTADKEDEGFDSGYAELPLALLLHHIYSFIVLDSPGRHRSELGLIPSLYHLPVASSSHLVTTTSASGEIGGGKRNERGGEARKEKEGDGERWVSPLGAEAWVDWVDLPSSTVWKSGKQALKSVRKRLRRQLDFYPGMETGPRGGLRDVVTAILEELSFR